MLGNYSRRSVKGAARDGRVLFNKLNHLCCAVFLIETYMVIIAYRGELSIDPTCADDACTIISYVHNIDRQADRQRERERESFSVPQTTSTTQRQSLVCVDEMDWIGMDVINLEWCYCSI